MKTIHTVAVNGEAYEILDAHAVERAVEKLCPSFSGSSGVVQCEPVEGYPLKVTTQLPEETGAATLTHCGKNLFDKERYALKKGYANYKTGELSESETHCRAVDFIPVSHLQGKTIILSPSPTGSNPGMAFYSRVPESSAAADEVFIGGNKLGPTVVPDNAEYMAFSVPIAYLDGDGIQIELGDAVTDFEPYRGQTYTATLSEESHDWGSVPALPGINTLYCNRGITTVKGKSDPVAIIEKLTLAIQALGGQV